MSDAIRGQVRSMQDPSPRVRGVRKRVVAMALVWLPLGAAVGALSVVEGSDTIAVFSEILAGMIVTLLLGGILGLIGGEIKPVLFGATSGVLVGALSGTLGGFGVLSIAGVGLIGGGIVGATLPAIMLRFRRISSS